MAGGTWTAQNKTRPGIYINFKSDGGQRVAQGDRGTVAIAQALSWGPVGQVTAINAGDDPTPLLGYPITEPQALFLREMFKGTNVTSGPTRVLLYRLPASGAAPASATLPESSGVTATAKYPGVRGNDISVVVAPSVDDPDSFTVTTVVAGQIEDVQTAKTGAGLAPNDWVVWSGSGALEATAGTRLSGGADGTVQPSAYAAALTALEPYSFDILAYDGQDETTREAMTAFVKRRAEQGGRYAQLVTAGAAGADSRFVINNVSGAVLSGGTQLTPQQVVWWLAGAQAGAEYYQSLTYASYPGAVDVSPRMTDSEITSAILGGNIVLDQEFGQTRIETDINTLTTYTPDAGEVFHKNAAIRVCNSLANDLYREFSLNFLGKVKNNEEGRGLFKAAILDYLLTMYSRGALRERPSSGDVTVEQGGSPDSIVITIAIQIGDAVEKVYLTISVS